MAESQPPPYSEVADTFGSSSNNNQSPTASQAGTYRLLPHSSLNHLVKTRDKSFDTFRSALKGWKASVEKWSTSWDRYTEQVKELKKVSDTLPESEKLESFSHDVCHKLAQITAISTILMHDTGCTRFSKFDCHSVTDNLPHHLYNLCSAYETYSTANDDNEGVEQGFNLITLKQPSLDERMSALETEKADKALKRLTDTLKTGVRPDNLAELDRTFIQAIPYHLKEMVPGFTKVSYSCNRPDEDKVRRATKCFLQMAKKWDELYTEPLRIPMSTTEGEVSGAAASSAAANTDSLI